MLWRHKLDKDMILEKDQPQHNKRIQIQLRSQHKLKKQDKNQIQIQTQHQYKMQDKCQIQNQAQTQRDQHKEGHKTLNQEHQIKVEEKVKNK